MAFGLFKKYCAICGKEVEKGKSVVRFGKHLCSEEHADEFRQKLIKEKSKSGGSGGCCG